SSTSEQAVSEYVIGRVLADSGDLNGALEHFQRSVSLALRSNDLRQVCWSQIVTFCLVSERSGPDSAGPLLAELRLNATRLGDSRTTAALHIHVGATEAKRGLFDGALRHLAIGRQLLETAPNSWLAALVENVRFGISVLR